MTSSNADKFTPRPGMVFETLEQAEAWLDATPDTSSIITNTPGPGQFTVVMQQAYEFGDYRDLMASGLRQEKRRELADREEYEAALNRSGAGTIGVELAAELGLSGDAAFMFAQGFCGEPAKVANPRALGLESVFRDGRKAKESADAQRRVRVAAHNVRSKYTFSAFVEQKYHCTPVPYYVDSPTG